MNLEDQILISQVLYQSMPRLPSHLNWEQVLEEHKTEVEIAIYYWQGQIIYFSKMFSKVIPAFDNELFRRGCGWYLVENIPGGSKLYRDSCCFLYDEMDRLGWRI